MKRWWRWCNGKMAVTIICWVMSYFISQNCPPKLAWKSPFYCNIWNAAAGQKRLWRHWKLLGMKVLIKHFKESGLAPETMLRTQRSRPFLKPGKTAHFWHFNKGGLNENFMESFSFTNGWKWHVLCIMRRWWPWCKVQVAVTIICWAMSIFISQNLPSKLGMKKCFLPQQLECRCGPTATVTSLKATWIEGFHQAHQGSGLAPETMLRTQRSRPFSKPEKWLIFGILAKWGPHDNFLENFNFTSGWKWHI